MARRVLNRRELREESEAADRMESAEEKVEDKATKKPAAKRKSRVKTVKEVRLKAFWGVFNQAMSPVVLFEYSQEKEAQQKAGELSESKRSPHFVQLVKKVIEE